MSEASDRVGLEMRGGKVMSDPLYNLFIALMSVLRLKHELSLQREQLLNWKSPLMIWKVGDTAFEAWGFQQETIYIIAFQ